MKSALPLFVAVTLLLGGCAGLREDLNESYGMLKRSINGVVEAPPDPVKEQKKRLPVYDGTCPPVTARPDLIHLVEFNDPDRTSPDQKVSEVTITNVTNTCRIEGQSLVMQIDIDLSGTTGPRARVKSNDQPNFAYPYFVAVTDDQGIVISKELFAATISYGRKENSTRQTETIFQNMPFPDATTGRTYNVVVGFQLTNDQLVFNTANGAPPAPSVTSTVPAAYMMFEEPDSPGQFPAQPVQAAPGLPAP